MTFGELKNNLAGLVEIGGLDNVLSELAQVCFDKSQDQWKSNAHEAKHWAKAWKLIRGVDKKLFEGRKV